jgi:hypothetical protein
MSTVRIDLKRWSTAHRAFWEKRAPICGNAGCAHPRTFLSRMRSKASGVRLHGAWYCSPECLERAVAELLQPRSASVRVASGHRIPLGLILLSRQQLRPEQLQAALDAQRTAGAGKIGHWLQGMKLVTEQQLTSALARQWSCPVLRADPLLFAGHRVPEIPLLLLECFHMIPIDFVEATATLHVAFGEGIEYAALYAIEKMLGCRTEPCIVASTVLQQSLLALIERRGRAEVVFDRVADTAEFARILRSYAHRLAASEVRLAPCGPYVWLRLERSRRSPVNLLLRTPPSHQTIAAH